MDTMRDPQNRLPASIEDRIYELGLEYIEVARRAGISVETLAKARQGKHVGARSLRKIEIALNWPPRTADRIRDGQEESPDGLAAASADPQPASEWDGEILGPEGVVDAGEVLMWRDTPTGRLYRLADAHDTRFHAEYEFPPGETPEQAIDGLRRMLAMHRAIIGEMDREMDRRRAKR